MAWLSNKLPIEEAIKRSTTRIFSPLLSLNYSDEGQQAIAVLTIDDTDLKEYGLNWPVPLDYYQRLLDSLVKRKPKAIFLDILFLDDKPKRDVERLIGAACRATEAGVPVFLATVSPEASRSNPEQQLFAARTGADVPCLIAVRPIVTPDELDQSQWAYPLRTSTPEQLQAHTAVPDSVALSLYCRLYKSTCPDNAALPLALVWATNAASSNMETMVVRNNQGRLMPVCRAHWDWWEMLPGSSMLRQIKGQSALPLCPYNQVIPVRAFKNFGFTAEQLDAALLGKVVMIGVDLKSIGDNLISPIHGRLPGVHVHAMALDNLISFKGKYRENGDFEWHELWHSSANIFIFLSLLLTSCVMVFWGHYKEILWARSVTKKVREVMPCLIFKRSWPVMIVLSPLMLIRGGAWLGGEKKSGAQMLLMGLNVLVYGVLCIVIFILGYDVYRQGPLTIIEYVLFPFMAHFLHLGESLAQRSRNLWKALHAEDSWDRWARLDAKKWHKRK